MLPAELVAIITDSASQQQQQQQQGGFDRRRARGYHKGTMKSKRRKSMLRAVSRKMIKRSYFSRFTALTPPPPTPPAPRKSTVHAKALFLSLSLARIHGYAMRRRRQQSSGLPAELVISLSCTAPCHQLTQQPPDLT
jgi:hypothetical protein